MTKPTPKRVFFVIPRQHGRGAILDHLAHHGTTTHQKAEPPMSNNYAEHKTHAPFTSHLTTAVEHLRYATNPSVSPDEAARHLAAANVRACCAAVEQQRIDNLISLLNTPDIPAGVRQTILHHFVSDTTLPEAAQTMPTETARQLGLYATEGEKLV